MLSRSAHCLHALRLSRVAELHGTPAKAPSLLTSRTKWFATARSRNLACALTFALLGCGSADGMDLFRAPNSAACSPGSARCSPDRVDGGNSAGATGTGGSLGAGGAMEIGGYGGGGTAESGGAITAGSGGATEPPDSGHGHDAEPPDAGHAEAGPVPGCPVRDFNGTLSGSGYKSQIGPVNVTATIAFTVVASGAIEGSYATAMPATETATLRGHMNCRTNAVTITVQDGSYDGVFPFASDGTFSGTMTGSYALVAASFSGTWKISENNPSYGGEGVWTAE